MHTTLAKQSAICWLPDVHIIISSSLTTFPSLFKNFFASCNKGWYPSVKPYSNTERGLVVRTSFENSVILSIGKESVAGFPPENLIKVGSPIIANISPAGDGFKFLNLFEKLYCIFYVPLIINAN